MVSSKHHTEKLLVVRVTDEVEYFMALDERGKRIVEAATEMNEDGYLANEFVTAEKMAMSCCSTKKMSI